MFAAATTAALIACARNAGRTPLPWMLGLEAVLLAVFVAIVVLRPPVANAADWHGIVAGLFAASAMGAQSALVRLLMKGIPQTNVMTGNMNRQHDPARHRDHRADRGVAAPCRGAAGRGRCG